MGGGGWGGALPSSRQCHLHLLNFGCDQFYNSGVPGPAVSSVSVLDLLWGYASGFLEPPSKKEPCSSAADGTASHGDEDQTNHLKSGQLEGEGIAILFRAETIYSEIFSTIPDSPRHINSKAAGSSFT